MIKVCGLNKYNQLIKKPNSKASNGHPIILPPLDFKNDSLLSCSFYSSHSAIITQEGKLQVIGCNEDCRISASLPKETLMQLTKLPLKDNDGNQLFPISVVCGGNYTLLLVSTTSSESDSDRRLAFFSKETKTKNPIFVSIGSHNPVSLFGGFVNAAAIDAEGGINFITESAMKGNSVEAPRAVLPGGEEAVSVACCNDFFCAVGSSGRVFISEAGNPTDMKIVSELSGVTINEVSGTCEHCIAVSSDGRVFGRGSNFCGKLGLGKVGEATEFTENSSLKKHKIISASAGVNHSLFITTDGKVLACGKNSFGELLISSGQKKDKFLSPVETSITGGASFCIAGHFMSVVFLGEVPPNAPNQRVCHNSKNVQPKKSDKKFVKTSNERAKEKSDREEELIRENETLRSEVARLKSKLSNNLIKERKEESESEKDMNLENETLLSEVARLKQENSELRKENSELKSQLSKEKEKKEKEEKRVTKHEEQLIEILDPETMKSLRHIRILGSGGNGQVIEVGKEEKYALKMMNAEDASISSQRSFINEIEKLKILCHPNIIRAHGIFLSDETTPFSILLELCSSDVQREIQRSELSKVERANIIYQTSACMRYVHSRGIIHRDLKPQNILLGNDGFIRVSDFGISKLMSAEVQSTTLGKGTLPFMAPELLKEEEYDSKVDVYSFGVVVFFIVSNGELPKINIIEVGNGKKAKIPSTFTKFTRTLIDQCWNFDPKTRPSFKEIDELLEKNIDQLFEFTKSESSEVRNFVQKHKTRLPLIND